MVEIVKSLLKEQTLGIGMALAEVFHINFFQIFFACIDNTDICFFGIHPIIHGLNHVQLIACIDSTDIFFIS